MGVDVTGAFTGVGAGGSVKLRASGAPETV